MTHSANALLCWVFVTFHAGRASNRDDAHSTLSVAAQGHLSSQPSGQAAKHNTSTHIAQTGPNFGELVPAMMEQWLKDQKNIGESISLDHQQPEERAEKGHADQAELIDHEYHMKHGVDRFSVDSGKEQRHVSSSDTNGSASLNGPGTLPMTKAVNGKIRRLDEEVDDSAWEWLAAEGPTPMMEFDYYGHQGSTPHDAPKNGTTRDATLLAREEKAQDGIRPLAMKAADSIVKASRHQVETARRLATEIHKEHVGYVLQKPKGFS